MMLTIMNEIWTQNDGTIRLEHKHGNGDSSSKPLMRGVRKQLGLAEDARILNKPSVKINLSQERTTDLQNFHFPQLLP